MSEWKPWEETWGMERRGWGVRFAPEDEILKLPTSTDPATDLAKEEGRNTLAMAAPELARALLAVEWSGVTLSGYDEWDDACPACGADAPFTRVVPARRVDAYARIEAHEVTVGGKHDDDCELDAALKKAGVR
jgi:hypothetical protein